MQDAEAGLYDCLHLNFTSQIPRPLLDTLAEGSLVSRSQLTPSVWARRLLECHARSLFECGILKIGCIMLQIGHIAGTVKRRCAQQIVKVHDQHLAFIALEPSIFSLGLSRVYLELNDPSAVDTQIEVGLPII